MYLCISAVFIVGCTQAQPMDQLLAINAKYANPSAPSGKGVFTSEEEAFLDDLQKRSLQFFLDSADPVSGLMPDRAKADGSKSGEVASIASVGFGLTALCIGDERGWISHDEAYGRCLKVLQFLWDKVEHHHGHFYHFLDMRTGKRAWKCELSNIDTAILMAGALTARQHFPNTELAGLATKLYERVDWNFLLAKDGTLCMGWRPEEGFIESWWNNYDESPLLYLVALGSPTHPLPPASWNAWKRERLLTYAGLTFLQCPPLFTHQFPHCWFDLRGQRDATVDYFRNSQLAVLAQRAWCKDELSKRFPEYGENIWGISSSDTLHGYDGWGGPPEQGKIDGSVVPYAAAGCLPFQPRLCIDALKALKQRAGEKGYVKFGFVDAFQPNGSWFNPDVIGIDVGPTIVMVENARSAFVWKTFMSAPEAQAGLKAAGFRPLVPEDMSDPATSILPAKP
jgi:hypothetical protein